LQQEFTREDKQAEFETLKGFLTGEHAAGTFAAAAQKLGRSEGALKMSVQRLKGRFRERLREQIAQTVSGPDEIDAEIRDLFAAFGN
jgi:RNA polymerase sigma-70 factor (ECF subfamily)